MKFLSLWLTLLLCSLAWTEEKAMVVVIPSYNNLQWYKKNLDSVLAQKYTNFRIILIDDASPDGTGPAIQQYIQEKNAQNRVTFIQNSKRVGALANEYKGIWLCRPSEIVVNLDGDDWMPHNHVLEKLSQVYADPNVWVTYGQFVYHTGDMGWAAQVPTEIIEQNAFREYTWVTTAMRTFYAGLFHKIKKEDLLYEGQFFQMSGDLAYMFPIIEMAGKHSRFIPDVLYVYNVGTSINDVVKDPTKQRDLNFIIRARAKYEPVSKPY